MPTKDYIVLVPGEDGLSAECLSREELLKRIKEEYWGHREFLDRIPDRDHNYWGRTIIVIKGTIVVPQPVETVTEWTV